jgi:hypothetical protein
MPRHRLISPARHGQPKLCAWTIGQSEVCSGLSKAQDNDSGGPAGAAAGARVDQRELSRIPNHTESQSSARAGPTRRFLAGAVKCQIE